MAGQISTKFVADLTLFEACSKSHIDFLELLIMSRMRKVVTWEDDTISHDPVRMRGYIALDVIGLDVHLG
jgi:hypothetical protein